MSDGRGIAHAHAHVNVHGHENGHGAGERDGHWDGHGNRRAGDHVPHVLALKTYLVTFGALIALTGITVGASYVSFGSWNLVIAILIATAKAATVALVFMHLWFDHKFHAVILGSSLVFLGIFIAFTLFDTETRGRSDAVQGERPVDVTNPFGGGTQSEAALRAKYRAAAVSAVAGAAATGHGPSPLENGAVAPTSSAGTEAITR